MGAQVIFPVQFLVSSATDKQVHFINGPVTFLYTCGYVVSDTPKSHAIL